MPVKINRRTFNASGRMPIAQNMNTYNGNGRGKEEEWKGQWWGKERKRVAMINQQTFKINMRSHDVRSLN